MPLLRERVRPVSAYAIARWLRELDDDQFTVREKASEELSQLGKFAEGPLRAALDKSPSLEAQRRIHRLLHLLGVVAVAGAQIHDVSIVATMETHGIGRLLTHNVSDFARFVGQITVLPLVAPSGSR